MERGSVEERHGGGAGEKPPYHVPLLTEIAEIPKIGRKVASTFSGCGGSSLGYKMAGFEVVWANEFVPAAQDTYRANHPSTRLCVDDIRKVTPAQLLREAGVREGELDVLDGSPPCSAFSTAGKREAGWGKSKSYSDGKNQVVDDLFFEFARLLRGARPRAFVAENVSGLVKGTAKGYFKMILSELRACGYVVDARVLDAQWLGVPQSRNRLIFVGVREDLRIAPAHPTPLPYRYTVRDALPWLSSVVHDTSGTWGSGEVIDKPSPAVTVGVNSVNQNHFKVRDVHALESDAVQPEMAPCLKREWDKLRPGESSEKYFSLVRAHPDKPSPCITQRAGTNAAGVTHPHERRKFTIFELRRICGFPDDFVLTGTYSQQWERLGRAVPPVMMAHVARVLRDEVFAKLAPPARKRRA